MLTLHESHNPIRFFQSPITVLCILAKMKIRTKHYAHYCNIENVHCPTTSEQQFVHLVTSGADHHYKLTGFLGDSIIEMLALDYSRRIVIESILSAIHGENMDKRYMPAI